MIEEDLEDLYETPEECIGYNEDILVRQKISHAVQQVSGRAKEAW